MILSNITNDYLLNEKENQYFDRKSARIKPNDIARHLVAFSNANGGVLAIGIEDNKKISGFDYQGANEIEDYLKVPYSVQGVINFTYEIRQLNDMKVLLIEIEPSHNYVIKTSDGSVYLRVGDSSKLLNHEQVTQLEYDKGDRYFEDNIILRSSFDDVNIELVERYKNILNTNLSIEEILIARDLMKDGHLTNAGLILFGKYPTKYLPGARVRLLKFDGNKMETGKNFNVIKDITYETALPILIENIKKEMYSQLRDFQYLDDDGIFRTVPEYPEFPWFEGIVNAVTHRNYSLQGDHIRVLLFNDHMEIFSPGRLPNIVTLDNMKYTRYSRNPKIARVLSDFGYVRELNEGVKRIYSDMQEAFLKDPVYTEPNNAAVALILENTILSRKIRNDEIREYQFDPTELPEKQLMVYGIIKAHEGVNVIKICNMLGLHRGTIDNAIRALRKKEIIEFRGNNRYGGYFILK